MLKLYFEARNGQGEEVVLEVSNNLVGDEKFYSDFSIAKILIHCCSLILPTLSSQ